jgi:predicted nucleic acid-binding protein
MIVWFADSYYLVMEQRQIRDALTGDQHFVQAGFHALLA